MWFCLGEARGQGQLVHSAVAIAYRCSRIEGMKLVMRVGNVVIVLCLCPYLNLHGPCCNFTTKISSRSMLVSGLGFRFWMDLLSKEIAVELGCSCLAIMGTLLSLARKLIKSLAPLLSSGLGVVLPAKVVHSLNLNIEDLNATFQPCFSNAFAIVVQELR